MNKPDFSQQADGLLPAIIQDAHSGKVLMLAYMNSESWDKTLAEKKVCFYSRSRKQLWTKGESSGNFLFLESIHLDCDQDTILIKAIPAGPVCHTGADTCFNETNPRFSLMKLERIITQRLEKPDPNSYTSGLFARGINRLAQKLGEEAIEMVIESKDDNREKFLGEAADLMFHYLVLLKAKQTSLQDVVTVLESRHGRK